MANFEGRNGSVGGNKTSLCDNTFRDGTESRNVVGESSLQREFEELSVSKRLVRSVSQKLRKKSHKSGIMEEEGHDRSVSSGCLSFYGKAGGCKVGAYISEELGDVNCRRKSSVGDEVKGYQPICGTGETKVDCFSNGVTERLWKRSSRKEKGFEEPTQSCDRMELLLPDDVLEMCLARLPLTALMTARLVCKKWRCLTTAPQFMQMRRDHLHQSPWLFLFGVVKDGYCTGQIHALDVSLDQWHRIDADILRGRFLFSVATIGEDVYVVGGCTSLSNFGRVDTSSFKTHKGILVFSPLTRSWRKVASMKSARSSPVLGVFQVGPDCSIFRNQKDKKEQRLLRSRVGGVSDVYEDPHRLSVRRQFDGAFDESNASVAFKRKPCDYVRQERNPSYPKGYKRFVLIAVGGLGSWDEPLNTGEIFDPVSNKWVEIMKLPADFGIVCSGVVCNGSFYVYSETDKLAAYDLERGIWVGIQTSQSPPRLHEYYPKLLSSNNRLFMLSVSWCEQDIQIDGREKAVRKLWELDAETLTWAEISRHPDAPMDWNAVFVTVRDQIFGVEMFKIFGQVLDFLTVFDVSSAASTWSRVSKKHVAHGLDASSCMTKSLAVLHL